MASHGWPASFIGQRAWAIMGFGLVRPRWPTRAGNGRPWNPSPETGWQCWLWTGTGWPWSAMANRLWATQFILAHESCYRNATMLDLCTAQIYCADLGQHCRAKLLTHISADMALIFRLAVLSLLRSRAIQVTEGFNGQSRRLIASGTWNMHDCSCGTVTICSMT